MGDLKQAMKKRRSHYSLHNDCPITDLEIKEMVDYAVTNVPSAFNSQSARVVLLLNGEHEKFWNIVIGELRKSARPENFPKAKEKIEKSFLPGKGTVLFYEDMGVVKDLQEKFPRYRENFPVWAEHTSAMHQFALWTLLADVGMGASLQHYSPVIDGAVAREWNLPPDWKLIAQMPFGVVSGDPASKDFLPLEGRSIYFG